MAAVQSQTVLHSRTPVSPSATTGRWSWRQVTGLRLREVLSLSQRQERWFYVPYG